jgi:Type II secretion system (T2SS), protein M subtype b
MAVEPLSTRALVWAVSRWWHGPGAFTTALVLSVVALTLVAWAWHGAAQARAARTEVETQLAGLRAERAAAPAGTGASASDFTAALPVTASPALALEVVQSAALRATVRVESAQVQEFAASPERLGRVELALTARGAYANVKRWMAEVTERVPASTVSRLQLQRTEGAPEVEARLTLVVLSQPTTASLERR